MLSPEVEIADEELYSFQDKQVVENLVSIRLGSKPDGIETVSDTNQDCLLSESIERPALKKSEQTVAAAEHIPVPQKGDIPVQQEFAKLCKTLHFLQLQDSLSPFDMRKIFVIENMQQWQTIWPVFKKNVDDCPVVGLACFRDAQPANAAAKRSALPVLTFATGSGLCMIIRLSKFIQGTDGGVPDNFKDMLVNCSILKVGWHTEDTKKRLPVDLNCPILGAVDIRFLALHYSSSKRKDRLVRNGLALPSLCNVILKDDIGPAVRGDALWNSDSELTYNQKQFCCRAPLMSLGLFHRILVVDRFLDNFRSLRGDLAAWDRLRDECGQFLDQTFDLKGISRYKTFLKVVANDDELLYGDDTAPNDVIQPDRARRTRKRRPAQMAQSSAGEERISQQAMKKASHKAPQKHVAVPVGDNGTATCNVCCKPLDAVVRHFVFPETYRRHCLEEFRDALANLNETIETVSLCVPCSGLYAAFVDAKQRELSSICDAPLHSKGAYRENPEERDGLYRVKSAAVLLSSAKSLSAEEEKDLIDILATHFQVVSPSVAMIPHLISKGCSLNVEFQEVPTHVSHGFRVVLHFAGGEGLLALRRYWRQVFSDKMKPQGVEWKVDAGEQQMKGFWSAAVENGRTVNFRQLLGPTGAVVAATSTVGDGN